MWFRDEAYLVPKIGTGARFMCRGDVYLLAQPETNFLGLVRLKDGEGWGASVRVEDPNWITEYEWSRICRFHDAHFTLIALKGYLGGPNLLNNAKFRSDEDKVHMGAKFVIDNEPSDAYVLSQVDVCKGRSRMALISIKDGNRWGDPIEVATPSWVSRTEWDAITGGEERFKKVNLLVTLA